MKELCLLLFVCRRRVLKDRDGSARPAMFTLLVYGRASRLSGINGFQSGSNDK